MIDEQFQTLLDELADGSQSLAGLSATYDLTSLTDEQLSELRQLSELEVAISDHRTILQPFASRVGQKLSEEIDNANFVRDTVVATANARDNRRTLTSRLILTLGAVSLAIAAAVIFLQLSPSSEVTYTPSGDSPLDSLRTASRQVATVISVETAEKLPKPLRPGAPLQPGVLELEELDTIELLFSGGGLAEFSGPGRLELLTADSTFLHAGSLAVNTGTRKSVQFTVHTPSFRAIDQGTAFGIHVDPSGSGSLTVYEGAVGIEPTDGSTPRQLYREGQSVLVDASGTPSPAQDLPSNVQPVSVEVTPFASPPGYSDLVQQNGTPLVYLDFQDEADIISTGFKILGKADLTRSGNNASLHLPSTPRGTPQGLQLQEPIQISKDGALSVECWISHPIGATGAIATLSQPKREDEKDNRYTFILSLAEWRSSDIASYFGKPRATFRLGWPETTEPPSPDNWRFGQDLYLDQLTIPGKWTHFAATYSDGRVKFYRDGVLKKEASAPPPTQDLPAFLTIGQLSPWHPGRHFTGMIDEFAIHPRELTPEEIRERVELTRAGQ